MSKWIDCDEYLPDDDLLVLVHMPRESDPVWLGYVSSGDEEEDQDTCWVGADGMRLQQEVTHWMELPEGPVAKEVGSVRA
jgi:hypothetical protein